jgi:hypothetical protein
MVFCEDCNKEYKRITKSHLNSKEHRMNKYTSFKDLNKNLNEYNLIKVIFNYSFDDIDKKYQRIKHKLDEEYIYWEEELSIDFIIRYKDFVNWDHCVGYLNELKEEILEGVEELENDKEKEDLWIIKDKELEEFFEKWNKIEIECKNNTFYCERCEYFRERGFYDSCKCGTYYCNDCLESGGCFDKGRWVWWMDCCSESEEDY